MASKNPKKFYVGLDRASEKETIKITSKGFQKRPNQKDTISGISRGHQMSTKRFSAWYPIKRSHILKKAFNRRFA